MNITFKTPNFTYAELCTLTSNYFAKRGTASWLHCLILLLAGLLLSGSALAQTPAPLNCPSVNRCTANDLTVLDAYVEGADECTCTDGLRNVYLRIRNNNNSLRTSVALFGNLSGSVINGTGSVPTILCGGPILPKDQQPADGSGQVILAGQVNVVCGQALTLTDVFIAFTDASGTTTGDTKNSCNTIIADNCKSIAPKCGTVGTLTIRTPLSAVVSSATSVCPGGTGCITLTVSGGTSPYFYTVDGIAATRTTTSTANAPTFCGLTEGPHTIVVTDSKAGTACTKTVTGTVGTTAAPAAPTLSPTQPTCTTATGSITVTAPVSTTNTTPPTYTYSLDDGTFGTATTFSGLAAGSRHCVRVKNAAGCISSETCLTLNAQPPTPAGPNVLITESTLCGTATRPTLTICSPEIGTSYAIYEANGTTALYTTAAYTSGGAALTFPMNEGKGFRVIATNSAGCVSDATTCSNNPSRIVSSANCTTTTTSGVVMGESADNAMVSKDISTEAYPNPTGRDATINFSVPKSGRVVVEVYNSIGSRVATLYDGKVSAGEQRSVVLKGSTLPSGTYTYRVISNGKTKTSRISLVK